MVEKQATQASGSNSYSLPIAILQLNCPLSSCTDRQLEGERERIKYRFTAVDLSQPMLFCPKAKLGDIKEKHDEKPPNDTQ